MNHCKKKYAHSSMGNDYLKHWRRYGAYGIFFVVVSTWFNQMINAISLVCIGWKSDLCTENFIIHFELCIFNKKWRKMPLFSSYCINFKVRFDVIYDRSRPRYSRERKNLDKYLKKYRKIKKWTIEQWNAFGIVHFFFV